MQKQFYFSFVLAILSFITVKSIQKVGVERYHIIQSPVFQKENGWFNLSEPEQMTSLPFELREISGLTDFSRSEVACVQDEDGIIYFYNLLDNTINNRIQFSGAGDYEGLTFVDSTFYILRSDATLFSIKFPSDSAIVDSVKLMLPAWDNEGLCYDKKDERLLIASKSRLAKGPAFKDIRGIYEMSLVSGKLNNSPLFEIRVSELIAFALENNLPLPQKETHNLNDTVSYYLKFMPSSISVHPKTDEIYVISAVDHSMAIFDKTGKIVNFVCLDPLLFNKPEGITFLENGDMIITNEGQMGSPTLLRFNWKIGGKS
jgi:hypothetical protein